MNLSLFIAVTLLVAYEPAVVSGNSSADEAHESVMKIVHKRAAETSPESVTYEMWSNVTFWNSSSENNNKVPTEGSDVVIPSGKWVVADVALPVMKTLTIYGTLELMNNTDPKIKTILSATYILIQGGRLLAGNKTNPFPGELSIILRGNRSTTSMTLPTGKQLGSKVIGVFGRLDLYGIPHTVYKTKLAVTASVGSNNITLVQAVDWQVGDEIVITTSSYKPWQTEIRKIVAFNESSITLNASLSFTHLGKSYQLNGLQKEYTLAADVALLSRNIQIIGEDYPGWYQDSFGARVLVGTYSVGNTTYSGSASIENVEFYHSGQQGFTDPADPHYSLAFLNLGEVPGQTSHVMGCAFHDGFSPAIGIFNTSGLDIDDNVIHFTVGEGIRVQGDRIRVRRNLVSLSVWPGSYQGKEDTTNIMWNAAMQITYGNGTVLQNNVVSGFERVGYAIDGEQCKTQNGSEEWTLNEAHGGLIGVYLNGKGQPGCTLIRRFNVWKCWDYGIYSQTESSVVITEMVLANNGMGILPIVYGPPAISHDRAVKTITITASLIVGSTPDFDCNDIVNASESNIKLSVQHRSPRPPSGGRSGICWPTFTSAHNGAPQMPLAGVNSYNAIGGLMTVTDVVFDNFRNSCSSEANVMFMTNPLNEDLQHPLHVSSIRFTDSSEDQKVFIHRPDVSKANPTGCVDMTCDAKKKALLKDLDGSFLGQPGTVIPQSEYQWNGLSTHGLGDARIPKVMLTRLNGSHIPVSEVAPYKGIIRDAECVNKSTWNGYLCTALNYEMLVIESLDPDTETRRLSPVAILGDGYVDILNGPPSHSSCSGASCNNTRVSMFHAIVATNKSYEIYFNSSTPQNLRLTLLNANSSKSVRVGIFYPRPQRLDVYVDSAYVSPTNAEMTGNGTDFTLKSPTYRGEYLPQLNSTVSGENFLDETYNMFYTLAKGSSSINIYTTPSIVLSFKLPAMTADQFNSTELLKNIAAFLKIQLKQIRLKKVVAAANRRRKRATGGLDVDVVIGDPPAAQRSTSATTGAMTFSDLQGISKTLAAAVVVGSLSTQLKVNVSSLLVSNPIPSPSDPGYSQMAAQEVTRTQAVSGNFLATVSSLVVVVQPIAGKSGQLFSQQPVVKALDSNGNCVDVSASSLSLTTKLKNSNNTYVTGGLKGDTSIVFTSCWANYTNLGLILPGEGYSLEFILNNVYAKSSSFRSTDSQTSGGVTTQSSIYLLILLLVNLLSLMVLWT